MIGFLDSGIGGLSVLNACKKVLRYQNVLYYCDSKNMPYGSKSKKEIIMLTVKGVKVLAKKGCKIVVIACNTATACAISVLRKKYPNIVFVGTEPNIKTPVKLGYKKIAVLTTPATAKFSRLLKAYEATNVVEVLPLANLAKCIENGDNKFDKHFDGVDFEKFDAVVLGCTHYVFAKKELEKLFCNAAFFDSNFGIKKRLAGFLGKIEYVGLNANLKENLEEVLKKNLKNL